MLVAAISFVGCCLSYFDVGCVFCSVSLNFCLPFMWFGWLVGLMVYIAAVRWHSGYLCIYFSFIRFRVCVSVSDVFFSSLFPCSSWWLFFNVEYTTQQTHTRTQHTFDPIYRVCVCYCCLFGVLSFTLSVSAGLAKVEHYDTTIQVESTPVGIATAHLKLHQFNRILFNLCNAVSGKRLGKWWIFCSRKF